MKTILRRTLPVAVFAALSVAGPIRADTLRNLAVGQPMPAFSLTTIDGSTLATEDLAGKAFVLVFLSAQQRSSESAAAAARTVIEDLDRDDVELVLVSADVAETAYFRQWREKSGVHDPLVLDFDRKLYGGLGLIVLPTTVVADREHRLAHVISSFKSDYKHVLAAYARHAAGLLSDEELEKQLVQGSFRRDDPAHKVARHRAAAKLLRENGLMPDAENELRVALAIDPKDVSARLDLAAVRLAQGDVTEALSLVQGVLAEHPDHRRGKLVYGIVLYHADRLAEAQEVLTRALLLNPDPAYTHYYLGLIAEKRGETAEALEHYRQSLARLMENRSP